MKRRSVNRSMFYNAPSWIFQKAAELRKNMTMPEKILWERLRKNQLGVRFKAQHPIDRFIVDFYCHKLKLVIEIDGGIHKQKREYDIGRAAEINKYDIKILRFKNEEVIENIDCVLNEIRKHM
ncbi:MAG: endonuclease domain-containing protein [Bacteroidales bacterium]|nr:endonuclease domain-containing protein [Bacteroidales bacterium]